MVSKGCLVFLAHLRDDTTQVPPIESVSIVREFLDVFLADLPGMPPDSRFEQQTSIMEKLAEQWIPRRTVMGTTDRRGGLVPKYLEFLKMGTEMDSLNFVTEWKDGLSQV